MQLVLVRYVYITSPNIFRGWFLGSRGEYRGKCFVKKKLFSGSLHIIFCMTQLIFIFTPAQKIINYFHAYVGSLKKRIQAIFQ